MRGAQELNDLISAGSVRDPIFRSASLARSIYEVLLETPAPPRLTPRQRAYYAVRPWIPKALRWALQRTVVPQQLPSD